MSTLSIQNNNKILDIREPTEEETALRIKLENYEEMIAKLRKEVDANTTNQVGTETLTTLLQEAQRDITRERKKSHKYEAAINVLQRRLIDNDINADLITDEQWLPGPSQKNFDNLVAEISRLKAQLNNCNQENECLHNVLQQDRQKEQQYRSQITRLETTLSTSVNDKDQELASLRNEIRGLQAKDRAHQMEKERWVQVTRENERLSKENDGLKLHKAELEKANDNWAEYEKDRGEEVDHVLALKLNAEHETAQVRNELQRETARATRDYNALHTQAEHETAQVRNELQRETARATQLERDYNALQTQVNACTEDFIKEKQDKEIAQRNLNDLQARMLTNSPEFNPSVYQQFQDDQVSTSHQQQHNNDFLGDNLFGGRPMTDGPSSVPRQPVDHAGLTARGYQSMAPSGAPTPAYDEVDAPFPLQESRRKIMR